VAAFRPGDKVFRLLGNLFLAGAKVEADVSAGWQSFALKIASLTGHFVFAR